MVGRKIMEISVLCIKSNALFFTIPRNNKGPLPFSIKQLFFIEHIHKIKGSEIFLFCFKQTISPIIYSNVLFFKHQHKTIGMYKHLCFMVEHMNDRFKHIQAP